MIQKQLSLLGDCITTYKGEGVLTFKDGFSVSCTFEAGQVKQGDIFLFCDCSASTVSLFFTPVHKFEGTTTQWSDPYRPDRKESQNCDRLGTESGKGENG